MTKKKKKNKRKSKAKAVKAPPKKKLTISAVIAGSLGAGLIGLGLFETIDSGNYPALYFSVLGAIIIAAVLWSYR